MTQNKSIGTLIVLDLKEMPDGSALVTFDITDAFKTRLKSVLGWKRWSNKKFQKYVIQALNDYAKGIEDGTILR